MEKTKLKTAIEALLFMATEPVSLNELKKMLSVQVSAEEQSVGSDESDSSDQVDQSDQSEPATEISAESATQETEGDAVEQIQQMQAQLEAELSKSEIKEAVEELIQEYAARPHGGFELVEVAKGYQFRTREAAAPFLRGLYKMPKTRLSTPSMETLAIIAYQQPLTRTKVEEIRGVDSGGVMKTLLDRDLVRIVGRSEEPGRPLLYGTTKAFLEVFGLSSLADLPTLKDLDALEDRSGSGSSAAESSSESAEESGFFKEDEALIDFAELEGEAGDLIEELENSMRSLKDLEKHIFNPEGEKVENAGSDTPGSPKEG